jgi:ribonuclease HI
VCERVHELGGISDHEPVMMWRKRNYPQKKAAPKGKHVRQWKKASTELIVREIRAAISQAPADTEGKLRAWDDAWAKIKRDVVPTKYIRTKAAIKRRSFMNKEIEGMIKRRNRLWKKAFRASATVEDKQEFRSAKEEVRDAINKEQTDRIQEATAKSGTVLGCKQWWRFVDSLRGRRARDEAEPDCGPDRTNDAFIEKPRRIKEPMDNVPLWKPQKRNIQTLSTFRTVSQDDVKNALRGAKNTSSCGIDEVPMSILKKVGPQVAAVIADIANAIIKEERWPDQWKKAEIRPIWKRKGSRSDPKYYRPIALLPAIARLVERIVAEQIKSHLNTNAVLPRHQHGFRARHSPVTAITELVDLIASARDAGEAVVVASLDLAAAFDTIEHDLLCEKLEQCCGINGSALSLIRQYLQNRQQRTKYTSGACSSWRDVPWGVPQGSVWGPILFTLYCVDIGEAVTRAEKVQFADDVTLVVSSEKQSDAIGKMNMALEQFGEYAQANRLAAEPTKTQIMYSVARNQRKQMDSSGCRMAGNKLEAAPTLTTLGVTIDEQLTWEAQFASAAGKADRATAAIRRSSRHLRKEERALLAGALAHPYLEYCQVAFAGPTETANSIARRAYNRTARMAARAERSAPAREQLSWPEWEEKTDAMRRAFVSQIWHGGEPAALRRLMPETQKGGMRTRSQARGELAEAQVNTEIGRKAFRAWSAETYNRIRQDMDNPKYPQHQRRAETVRRARGKQPADEFATQRKAYYAYLTARFADRVETTDERGRVRVWTDGSARETAAGFKAGGGIWYGNGNRRNRGWAVGGAPTNQRAELTAFLRCIENDDRKLLIHTDSRYVQVGVQESRHRWKARAWYSSPSKAREIDNADLWKKVDMLLEKRSEEVHVQWVKGHALPHHIKMGYTTDLDIWGNNAADEMAARAASETDTATCRISIY